MAKRITTSIQINASKEIIWNILMDFEKYPEWNPFITMISGNAKVGSRIYVKLQGMTFNPSITSLKENSEFKWLGHLLVKGLFDGKHIFSLTDYGNGTTNFEQSENFKRILVRLFSKSLYKNTQLGFEQMNKELKLRAEKHHPSK